MAGESSLDKPWVDGLTIGEVLARTAERYPQNDALVFPQLGFRRSYREFLADVNQAMAAAKQLRDTVLKTNPNSVSVVSAGGAHTLVLVLAKEAAGQRDLNTPGVRD